MPRQKKRLAKLLVCTNGSPCFTERKQPAEGLHDGITDPENPDISQRARACLIEGWQVGSTDRPEEAMRGRLAAEAPVLLDGNVDRTNGSSRP